MRALSQSFNLITKSQLIPVPVVNILARNSQRQSQFLNNISCGRTFYFNFNVRFASSSSNKYKAAVVKKFGEPLVIEELKRKSLGKNDVRISVFCCGVNSVDLAHFLGEEPQPKLPFVPGYEIAGEILEVADSEDSSKFKIGQRVVGLNMEQHLGGFAEEIILPAKDVWTVDQIRFDVGASIINSYATALLALTRRASIKKNDTILVTGAAGRLGMAVIDLAANVYRAKVIGVVTSSDKANLVRERGAWATVTMGKQDLKSQINKITDGNGVEIIVDSVGGETFKEVVKCAADEGKVIVAGFASKKIPQISGEELLENSFSVLGVSLDQYRKKKFQIYRETVSEVLELYNDKLIRPINSTVIPLEKVNEAFEQLKDRNTLAKFVLDIKS